MTPDASQYDTMRHLADSWGLVAMGVVFLALCLWPFRPGGRADSDAAAAMIFADEMGDDDNV